MIRTPEIARVAYTDHMEERSLTPALRPSPLTCPRCGSGDLARDVEHPYEYVCAHCRTRSRLLPTSGQLLILGWICAKCGHDNERGNRFCTQCGTHLTKTCPNCGATMRAEDQFCNACGKSRGQLVAEWYRNGKGALDAGRPWDALPPLQRLANLDPNYGDVQRLLERAASQSAARPAPLPVQMQSPAAIAVRDAVASLKRGKRQRGATARLVIALIGGVISVVAVSALVGLLLHSVPFGVLFFLFLCALIVANVWISISNL